MEKKTVKKRAARALVWFVLAALALTYVSRAVSEALKAEVETGYASAGVLDESVEGTGAWETGDTQLYTTYFARRVSQLYVRPGQRIAPGDPLFAYDVSTVAGGKKVSDRNVRAAQRALEKAEAALAGAEDPAMAQKVVENARQALSFAEFTYEQYYAVQNGGVVRATFAGTLVKCDLAVGKASVGGSTGLEIAPEGVAFMLSVTPKEAERIAVGDAVTLYDDGQEEEQCLTVAAVQPPDAEDRVRVVCAGDGGRERLTGAVQDWRIEKQSARYHTCIPLAALRQSGPEEYYVLLLSEKETILGTQLVAQKQAVSLLARDSRRAAIEGGVSEQDTLITACSKELRDGDYVVRKDA